MNPWKMKIQREIAGFSVSCMNDTRWRRLFRAFHGCDLIGRCECQLLLRSTSVEITPFLQSTDDWTDLFTATGARDRFGVCPFEFKEIWWLEFPASWTDSRGPGLEPFSRSQDIEAIRTRMDAIGNVSYDTTSNGITLFGYR